MLSKVSDKLKDILDNMILKFDSQIKRGLNSHGELDSLQQYRLQAYGAKLDLPKSEKYDGCQRIRF